MSGLEIRDSIDRAYVAALTAQYMTSGLAKSGILPLCIKNLYESRIKVPGKARKMVSADFMMTKTHRLLLSYKQHRPSVIKVKGSYVDTEVSVELTHDDVRMKMR